MLKVKVRWGGFAGAPGWSNFYFDTTDGSFTTIDDAGPAATRVETFLNAIKAKIPNHVTMQIQNDVEVIAPHDGEMLNVHNIAAKPILNGGAVAAPYSAASGIVINWRTGGVRNGRRVRGRTFLVPIANSIYQSDGTISDAHVTDTVTAGTALITTTSAVKFGVWARPVKKDKLGNDLAVPIPGEFHAATNCSVPDLAAVLRSRR